MLFKKCVLMSGFILLMAMLNFADANQNYIVSFVAGKSGLGYVSVRQTDPLFFHLDYEITVEKPSITPLEHTFGTTAVLTYRSFWDGDVYYDVYATYSGDAANPVKAKVFSFNADQGLTYEQKIQDPGQFHPLHLFRPFDQLRLLAAGPFGTTKANDYVSYPLYSSSNERHIFVNPANRSAATAAVAPDGGLTTQMTFAGVNHVASGRVLNSNGNPIGRPFQLFNVNDFHGYSQSLSNPISSGTSIISYLAYRNFRDPGTVKGKSEVVIQNVDAKTGQKQGKPWNITNFAKALNVEAEKSQSIALSPNGGLILYTMWNDSCKKQILLASSLVNGSTVGKPKVVVGCRQLEQYEVGVYGISIAEKVQ
jgi:hypothetical protein